MITKINAFLFGALAVMHLSISGDFWRQLPTYFWQSQSVIVTGHSLRDSLRRNGPMGEVTFETVGDQPRRFTDHLDERYDCGDGAAKTSEFIARYAPGTTHVAYVSPDFTRASLGHFPRSYSLRFALSGTTFAIGSILMFWRWRADSLARRRSQG